jgi:predicted house-cleaning noncanonical NTP pyrophosphatase (MazG superfamily)
LVKEKALLPKLVRDNIPSMITANNSVCVVIVAKEDKEYIDYLKQKLVEEVAEFLDEPSYEEAGDVMEVIEAYFNATKSSAFSFNRLKKAKRIKRRKNGAFKKRFILHSVE